jgi:hypothetical protein
MFDFGCDVCNSVAGREQSQICEFGLQEDYPQYIGVPDILDLRSPE